MRKTAAPLALLVLLMNMTSAVSDDTKHKLTQHHSEALRDFAHGAPEAPSRSWMLAAGARLYDKWWAVVGAEKPSTVHPSYPAAGKQQNGGSWRCVECHGWDYLGRNGEARSGEHYTGIRGVNGARGRPQKEIAQMLRSPPHNYTAEMIPDRELMWLALFVSEGQQNIRSLFNPETGRPYGDVARGREVFQTVCASCHGHDGKAINFGDEENPSYVGTEARNEPYEVLHRIRNSKPGTSMTALRAFPLRLSASVLAYAQTLPDK